MAHRLVADRLVLRGWDVEDADVALGAYGDAEVARWLAPTMDRVQDVPAMRVVLQQYRLRPGDLRPARSSFF